MQELNIEGLRLTLDGDGDYYLHFGSNAAVNLRRIAEERGPITGKAILEWAVNQEQLRPSPSPFPFSPTESATILHALRVFQELESTPRPEVDGCAVKGICCDHFDDYTPLTSQQIDDLCLRININHELIFNSPPCQNLAIGSKRG